MLYQLLVPQAETAKTEHQQKNKNEKKTERVHRDRELCIQSVYTPTHT